ncbi:MAG: branched-chain amino acid ABC transporter permease [Chloroherpetonaceae bacterium]|nr:branched-chain amino acid ABC transporter permease [Chthonomonadaceae bacterium]MDW8208767.1 branched-chain amino acid ABC transporter permease [Chloroherpetonaceae bacterium]
MRFWVNRLLGVTGALALLYAISVWATENLQEYYFKVIILCGIYIILAVSLNLVNGITGQFSIGHGGFYAVGAYVGAAWTVLWQPEAARALPLLQLNTLHGHIVNLLIALMLGAFAAGCTGFLVGLPSLRLRGDYLAIVTLGFGEVIRVVLLNIDAVGGARGLIGIPSLVQSGNLGFFWVFLFVVLLIAISRNLLQSSYGLAFLAVREDEVAADATGVNTTRVKVTAFVLAAVFAGIAGVLYAHFFINISPDTFDMNTSIIITTMVVLGGSGSITGSVLAATFLTAMPELLRDFKEYRMVIFSTLLILIMLTRPQGLFGHGELGYATFQRLIRSGRGKTL